jgi:WD40 repeat protein
MQNKARFQNSGLSGMNLLLFAEHYFYSIFASLKALERMFQTGCENLQIIKRLPMIPVSSQSRKVLNSDGFLVIKLMQQLISYKGRCAVTNPVGLLRCILFQRNIFPTVIDMTSGPLMTNSKCTTVTCVEFNKNDPNFIVTASNGDINCWRMSPDGSTVTHLAEKHIHNQSIKSIAVHPHAPFFLFQFKDMKTAKLLCMSPDDLTVGSSSGDMRHKRSINSVAFDRTGRFVATGSDDNTIKIWRVSLDGLTVTCVDTLGGHDSCVLSVAFDPTGRFLASCSRDKTAKVWRRSPDGSIVDCLATLAGHIGPVVSVAFDPTGRFLATGSGDVTSSGVGAWYLWLLPTDDNPKVTWVATLREDNGLVLTIAFHPQLPLIATGSLKTAKIWRISSNGSRVSCVATMNNLNGFVSSVAFDPTGRFLVTASGNGARVWH